ncbi:MAG: hypothetical protein IJQ21_11540 [Lachnospiraceae bacterium]|nr:hypothetical protein [Lachnospiraceae bacterium]
MMSDLKRAMLLLPSSYSARWSLLSSVLFACVGVIIGVNASDHSSLSLTVFYCVFPMVMLCAQVTRLEIPFIVRTSPHKRHMMTTVPVLIQIVLEPVMWGAVLLALNTAGERIGLTPQYKLLYTGWYLLMCLVFCVFPAISLKLDGRMMVVYIIVLVTVFSGAVAWVPERGFAWLLGQADASSFDRIGTGSLFAIVLAGTLVTAVIHYLVLRVASRRMVNQMTMDRIK